VEDNVPSTGSSARGVRTVAIAAGFLAVIAGGAFVYKDFVVPARDINRFGVDEIRPWTAREVVRSSWPGGSTSRYQFPVSLETEKRLRKRCAPHVDYTESSVSGMCTFVIELVPESKVVMVARVGRKAVFLEYDRGIVPPPDISQERTRGE